MTCFLDCSTIDNSVGGNETDATECECDSGFEWDADKLECISSGDNTALIALGTNIFIQS